MTLLQQIYKIIKMYNSKEKMYSVVGSVSEIDETARTCTVTPIDDSPDLFDVRFQTSESQTDGLVIIPSKGSFVTVAFLNPTTGVIVNTSQIAKIFITSPLTEFNGGKLEGMVNIKYLTEKLNLLVSEINTLKASLVAHTHTGVTTGSGISGTSTITASFSSFSQSDYEDTKVTH